MVFRPCDPSGGTTWKSQTSSRPPLAPHGHNAVSHLHEHATPEHFVRPRRHFVLPPFAVHTLEVVNTAGLRPGPVCQRSPRWWDEVPDSIQLTGCVTGSSQDGTVRVSLQLYNELSCYIWVLFPNHRETVRPACPERWHSQSFSCGCLPELVAAQAKVNVKVAPKTLLDVLVVRSRIPLHSVRVHGVDLVIGACSCAVEEQQAR